MLTLLNNQARAIDKLQEFKVGALFMRQGTGKTGVAQTLAEAMPQVDYILWFTPFQNKTNLDEELQQWITQFNVPIDIVGTESISASDRIYLEIYEKLQNKQCPVIIVDESLKIKNWDAKRTKRMIELGKLCEYRLILNGTPISRNLLDLWPQMEFLSPKILNMGMAEFKNTFCEYTKITKRRQIKILLTIWQTKIFGRYLKSFFRQLPTRDILSFGYMQCIEEPHQITS